LPDAVKQTLGIAQPGYTANNVQSQVPSANNFIDKMDLGDFKTDLFAVSGLQSTTIDSSDFIIEPSLVMQPLIYANLPARVTIGSSRVIFDVSGGVASAPKDSGTNAYQKEIRIFNLGALDILGWAFSVRKGDTNQASGDIEIGLYTGLKRTFELTGNEGRGFMWNHSLATEYVFSPATQVSTEPGVGSHYAQQNWEATSETQTKSAWFDFGSTKTMVLKGNNVVITVIPVYITKAVRAAAWNALTTDTLHQLPIDIANDLFGK